MSCLGFRIERVGGISAGAVRKGERLTCTAVAVGGVDASAVRVGGMRAAAVRRGGIRCRVYQECRTNLGGKYLELDPEIVWILAGQSEAYNDVISNTSWFIEQDN